MKKTLVALVAVSGVAGCLEADQTSSAVRTPNSAGVISGSTSSNSERGSDVSSVTGNTYAYAAGGIESAGLQGFAGIVSGASVTAPPVTGSAVMTGDFEVAVLEAIFVVGDQVQASGYTDRGSLSLTADFDDRTLTGTGTGIDGGISNFYANNNVLTVNGTFSGDELSGTVSYDGVSGPMTGLVGSNEAIGVFHGNDDHQVHAGGFIVN